MCEASGPSSRAMSVDETPVPMRRTFYLHNTISIEGFSLKTVCSVNWIAVDNAWPLNNCGIR